MKQRTEDDVLARTPLSLTLGDKEYAVPVLPVMAQREWRKYMFAELGPILDPLNFHLTTEDKADVTAVLAYFRKSLSAGLIASLLKFPDKMIELVFAYREFGYAVECLSQEGVPDRDLNARFLAVLAAGPLVQAPGLPREEVLARATEEQMAVSFSAVMAVAFPCLPQIETVRNLVRTTTAASQHLGKSSN